MQTAEGSKLGPEAKPDASPEKREEEMQNLKYTVKPTFETVNVIGKSFDTTTGTIDRKAIGRVLMTDAAGFDGKHVLVDGDTETPIKTVKAAEEVEVLVEFVGGVKSLATVKFFNAYTRDNAENDGVLDVFTTETDKIGRVIGIAERMAEAHPECDGQWKVVTKDGRRVFLRAYAEVNEAGKISR